MSVKLLDELETLDDREALRAGLQTVNEHIRVLQETDVSNPWLSYLNGCSKALAGQSGDAINSLKTFVETREGRNEWRAFKRLGDLFVEEYPQLAKANYEKAAALKSNEPGVLFGLSQCAFKMGDSAAALGFARRAVDADGGRSVVYLSRLAQMLFGEKRWAEAEQVAASALENAIAQAETRPDDPVALMVVDRQYQLLIEFIRRRLSLPGSSADDFVRLAGYVRDRGRNAERIALSEAVRVLDRGLATIVEGQAIGLLTAKGELLIQAGKVKQSIEVFEKILEIDPSHEGAKEQIERLRSSDTHRVSHSKPGL